MSPKHRGLAVYLHHEFGSKKLIDAMYTFGYCISYTELRHFLTSAAVYVNSTQKPSAIGSYLPPEIVSRETGGHLIVAATDNWDHNERTVDGKRTTHAMTSIFVQRKSAQERPCPRILKTPSRTLNLDCVQGGDLSKLLPYKKPRCRPEPPFHPPVLPNEIQSISESGSIKDIVKVETVYNIARSGLLHIRDDADCVPPWGQFHAALEPAIIPESLSSISFNPILMANPTDHQTIYTTLKRLKESMNSLGQTHTPVYSDMELLTKALEITWAHPKELEGIIPCAGGMHFLMSVISGIGYLYGDAGLKQLLHESGVYAAGSVPKILAGKDFDRALYALRIIDKALYAQFLQNFVRWCEETDTDDTNSNEKLTDNLRRLDQAFSEDNHLAPNELKDLINEIADNVEPLLSLFREEGRATSPAFKFWDDFLCKVLRPLKIFISSARHGSWNVQESAIAQLLPSPSPGAGGIIGLTLRGPALVRWFLSRPITAQYSQQIQRNVTKSKEKDPTYYLGEAAAKRWKSDVGKLIHMFEGPYIDPFDIADVPTHLVNFATGAAATPTVQTSLVNALDKGSSLAEKFVKERLVESEDGKRKSFYDTLPKSPVKTMADMQKTVKIKNKDVSMDGEVMYLRLLAVNCKKKVPLKRVLSYENSPVPLSLHGRRADGLLRQIGFHAQTRGTNSR